MQRIGRIRVGITFFLIGLAVGLVASRVWVLPASSLEATREVRAGKLRLTNPLLECETAELGLTSELRPFRGAIEESIAQAVSTGQVKTVAVYFRDLNNGPWFGINEREEFIPASLLKLPTLIGVLRWAEAEPSILDRTISFKTVEDPKQQNFVPTQQIQPNTDYTVIELNEHMIRYSDNTAARILRGMLGDARYQQVYDVLGIPNIPGQPSNLRVKDYATFFRILFNASYLQPATSEFVLQLLTETEFTQGLVAGVPSTTPVAHKFGEVWQTPSDDHQLHDCGIIYHPQHPYLLCVMTRGNDFNQLASVIANISRVTYQNVDHQGR